MFYVLCSMLFLNIVLLSPIHSTQSTDAEAPALSWPECGYLLAVWLLLPVVVALFVACVPRWQREPSPAPSHESAQTVEFEWPELAAEEDAAVRDPDVPDPLDAMTT